MLAVEVAWITERKDRGSKVREERRYGAARVGELSIGIPFLRRILSLANGKGIYDDGRTKRAVAHDV